MMLEAFQTTEANWREYSGPPDFLVSESPGYVGRGVAALAADDDRARWNQRSVTSGDLADAYGFTDLDGSQPQVWRYIADSRGPDAPVTPLDPDAYR
jgi:hypothetical protein